MDTQNGNVPKGQKNVKKSHTPSKDIHLVQFQYRNPGHLQLRLLHYAKAKLMHWKHPNLSTPYWRLYLHSEDGAGTVWQGKNIRLTSDQAWLIAPDTAFGTTLEKHLTQYFVHFTLAPVYTCPPGIYPVAITPAMQSLLPLVKEGSTPDANGQVASPERVVVANNAFVLLALYGLPDGLLRERRLNERVLRVMEHIEREVSTIESLEELAQIAGMHPRSLIRVFKQEIGVTPMESLRSRRMALACDMLHHTNLSIEQIAAQTGFCDRYHFSRTFRRLYEVTPAAFRRLK